MDEGHCGLPTSELLTLSGKLLGVPHDLVRVALDLELQERSVVADRVGKSLRERMHSPHEELPA
jgi:exodeoxyribonuclease V alpha subunit